MKNPKIEKKEKEIKKGPLRNEQLRGCVPKTPLSFSLFLCISPPPVAKTGKRASSPQNKFILCLVAEKRRKISIMMHDGPLLELLYKIF